MANIPHVEQTILNPLLSAISTPDFQSKPRQETVINAASNPIVPGVNR